MLAGVSPESLRRLHPRLVAGKYVEHPDTGGPFFEAPARFRMLLLEILPDLTVAPQSLRVPDHHEQRSGRHQ